jgi:hypothetical protein
MNPTSSTSSTAETLGEKISQAGKTAKDTARDVAEQVKQTASSSASKFKESAADMAARRRVQTAEEVGRFGESLHKTAKSMEEEDPNIAYYAHRLADRLDHVAEYVRNRDLGALKEDMANLARRHPVAVLGGLFVAGLVIGNLVKAGATAVNEAPLEDDDRITRPSGSKRASQPISGEEAYHAASPAGI